MEAYQALTVCGRHMDTDYCGLYHAVLANKFVSVSVNMRCNFLFNPSPTFYDVQDGGKELKVQNPPNRQCLLSTTRNIPECPSREGF